MKTKINKYLAALAAFKHRRLMRILAVIGVMLIGTGATALGFGIIYYAIISAHSALTTIAESLKGRVFFVISEEAADAIKKAVSVEHEVPSE